MRPSHQVALLHQVGFGEGCRPRVILCSGMEKYIGKAYPCGNRGAAIDEAIKV